MSVTVVISHGENHDFLHQCKDILSGINILKGACIRSDGFMSLATREDLISTASTHSERHGVRSYDLLKEIESDKVFVVDSDFFCRDENFWEEAINSLDCKPMVSISKPWHLGVSPFPSTPFLGFDRKKVLERAPVREVWDHFGFIFPTVPTPLFDNAKYVMLMLEATKSVVYIDSWYPLCKRSYSFFHFWKSVKSVDFKMGVFQDESKSEHMRYQHLCGALCQKIFEASIGKIDSQQVFDDKFLFDSVFKKLKEGLVGPYLQIQDIMDNLGNQFFNTEDIKRFNEIKKFLEEFRAPISIGATL